jgi:hypothetical protein
MCVAEDGRKKLFPNQERKQTSNLYTTRQRDNCDKMTYRYINKNNNNNNGNPIRIKLRHQDFSIPIRSLFVVQLTYTSFKLFLPASGWSMAVLLL